MIKKISALLFFATIFAVKLYAGAGPPPPPPSGCWPPPCGIPLDGGVSFLIAAGVAYGGKKMYDIRKKNP